MERAAGSQVALDVNLEPAPTPSAELNEATQNTTIEPKFVEEAEEADELTSLASDNLGESKGEQNFEEKPEERRQNFNRLDPNRRSFSSPTVNILGTQNKTATNYNQQNAPKQQQVAPSAAAASQPTSGLGQKLRRRTALGLISSLGSSNFRLNQQQQQQQQQQPVASATSNWRQWFMGSSKCQQTERSSVSVSNNANSTGGGGKQSSSTRTRTRFLLRNLTLTTSTRMQEKTGESALHREQQQLRQKAVVAQRQYQPPADSLTGPTRALNTQVGVTCGLQAESVVPASCLRGQEEKLPASEATAAAAAADNRVTAEPEEESTRTSDNLNSSSDGIKSRREIVESRDSKGTKRTNEEAGEGEGEQEVEAEEAVDRSPSLKRTMPTLLRGEKKSNELIARANQEEPKVSLVERLIDSQLEWRQIIKEANGGESCLRSLTDLQLKRQEVIHELVQTERHHCLTLALMRQLYCAGLRQLNERRLSQHLASNNSQQQVNSQNNHSSKSLTSLLHSSGDFLQVHSLSSATAREADLIDLERLFPALDELIQAHELFFAHLRLRLVESCQHHQQHSTAGSSKQQDQHIAGFVGPLGDLLCDQFRLQKPKRLKEATLDKEEATTTSAGTKQTTQLQQQQQQLEPGNGHKLLQAYSKFCGQHYDSSKYYKQLLQTDKGFKQFIEHCNKHNNACRQRGIPECNLLVTQRLTKYPLLIEQLIKTSKDDLEEETKLKEALNECKRLLAELNNQLARKESFERLLDIYAQFCPSSYTIYNKHLRFTKHDLLQHKRLRQLVHSDDQIRIWSATRRKLFQVLCLILNDIIVFLRIETTSQPSGGTQTVLSAQQHHLSAMALDSLVNIGASGEHHHHHHEQQQQLLASQCALINVVSNALNSAHSIHSAGGFFSSAAAAITHHSSVGSSSNSNNSNNNPPPTSATNPSSLNNHSSAHTGNNTQQTTNLSANNNGQQATLAAPAANLNNVKYYFANIDNKSSVISLSKLLIREKAANEAQPRIYLISSSPRQPEMYELAFVSKRHQAQFIEKLKSCIEQHNQRLAQVHLSGEFFDEHFEELEDLDASGDLYDDDNDDEEEEEENSDESQQEPGVSECGEEEEDEEDCEDEEEEEEEQELEYCDENQPQTSEPLNSCSSTEDRHAPLAASIISPSSWSVHKRSGAKGGVGERRWRSSTMEELDFEHLDIEQELVEPPPQTPSAQGADITNAIFLTPNKTNASITEEQQSTLLYSTPIGGAEGCVNSRLPDTTPPKEQEGVASINSLNEHSSNATCSSTSSSDDSSEEIEGNEDENCRRQHHGSSSLSSTAHCSNESGLSERAKDSLDEAAAPPLSSKNKMKGARRRRAQRPRQVSNQSSSSSEAAHRQAIQLINCAQEHQQHPLPEQKRPDKAQVKSVGQEKSLSLLPADEEFDSGRGQDDSSCSSSSSTSGGGLDEGNNSLSCGRDIEPTASSRTHILSSSSFPSSPEIVATPDTPTEQSKGSGKKGVSTKKAKGTVPLLAGGDVVSLPSSPLTDNSLLASSTVLSSQAKTAASLRACPPDGATIKCNSNSSSASSTASSSSIRKVAPTGELVKCHSSGASSSSSLREKEAATITTVCGKAQINSGSSCSSLKCSAQKSSSATSKQRKLSTVSSMSSQLKLFNRLKSGFDSSTSSSGGGKCNQQHRNSMQAHCLDCAVSSNQHQQLQLQLQQQQQQYARSMSKQMRQQLRRSSFIPEQKMEELRDARIQLDKDKQEWQEKFDKMQEQLLDERRELDLAHERLKLERQQVANERELLYRKLDVLKENGILLSPSHKVIITAPELRSHSNNFDSLKNIQHHQLSSKQNRQLVQVWNQQQQHQYSQCSPDGGKIQTIQQVAPNLHPFNPPNYQQHQIASNSSSHNHYSQVLINSNCNKPGATTKIASPSMHQHRAQLRQQVPQTNNTNQSLSSKPPSVTSTPVKVPLHLSERGTPSISCARLLMSTSNSNTNPKLTVHLESHLI